MDDASRAESVHVHIRKTPHLLFHLFQCFSMLFSEKAEKAKKSNPLYFFCTCQTAKKKHKKSRLPNGQKRTKMDKIGTKTSTNRTKKDQKDQKGTKYPMFSQKNV